MSDRIQIPSLASLRDPGSDVTWRHGSGPFFFRAMSASPPGLGYSFRAEVSVPIRVKPWPGCSKERDVVLGDASITNVSFQDFASTNYRNGVFAQLTREALQEARAALSVLKGAKATERPTRRELKDFNRNVYAEVRGFIFAFPADAESAREARKQAEAAFGDMGFEDQPEVLWVSRKKGVPKP